MKINLKKIFFLYIIYIDIVFNKYSYVTPNLLLCTHIITKILLNNKL